MRVGHGHGPVDAQRLVPAAPVVQARLAGLPGAATVSADDEVRSLAAGYQVDARFDLTG